MMKNEFIKKPEWSWTKQDGNQGNVHHWIKSDDEDSNTIDIVLYGMPLSRSSISVSGASEYPTAFRKGWKGFSTYDIDEDIDLSALSVVDLGDVMMHGTDIMESHRRIEQATKNVMTYFKDKITVGIGGDHSITSCAIRGLKGAYPNESIGILQLDTHLDLRDPSENGPSNGTPIRQLIEGGQVKGENVINIGLHGFFNHSDLVTYGKKEKVTMITLKKARQQGIVETIKESLDSLDEKVDRIYVTIDMDVLDISCAPGVPASTPGGMATQELFDALFQIGQHRSFQHIDFVCLDPTKDAASSPTVKAGVYGFLKLVSGIYLKRKLNDFK